MDSTATVHTVTVPRALALGLFGAGVVTALMLFGGSSEARADGILPLPDGSILGTIGSVVDSVVDPVDAVVDTVITEVVTPVAVVADEVVSQVPVVNTIVDATLGSTPVADVVAVVGTTVDTTVGGVTAVVDQVTGTVPPGTIPTPGNPVVPGLPGTPGVAGPVISGVTVSTPSAINPVAFSSLADSPADHAFQTDAITPTPAPLPSGSAGSSVPAVAIAPSGSGSSSANGSGSAGGSALADDHGVTHSFVPLSTGRENARDDDLPPSPCSEFDTSPD